MRAGTVFLGFLLQKPLYACFMEPEQAASHALRLGVVDARGTLHVWAWDASKYAWRDAVQLPAFLPFPTDQAAHYQLVYSSTSDQFVVVAFVLLLFATSPSPTTTTDRCAG